MNHRNDTGSAIMLITSMLIFGSIGLLRRSLPLSSSFLACYRGMVGALVLIIVVKLQKKPIRHSIGLRNVLLLLLTGAMIGLNWILLFEAYRYTTVATATLCYYMEPTIVILLSPFFFSEHLSVKKMLCAFTSIIGMVLVSGVADSKLAGETEPLGILFGLGAAVLYAAVVMANKKIDAIDPYEKTILQLFAAGVTLLPYTFLTEDLSSLTVSPKIIILLVIIGFIHTGLAYLLYFKSMSGLSAQSIALFSYIDPISALILSALLLRERMSTFAIIGAILILGATIVSEISFLPKASHE